MSARHDYLAERHLLELTLSGHPAIRAKFLTIPAAAWAASNEPVATVLRDRIRRDIPLDPLAIAGDAASTRDSPDQAEQLRQYVLTCASTSPPLADWDHYAGLVGMCHAIREADTVAACLGQRLETATEPGEVADIVRTAITDLDTSADQLVPTAVTPPTSLQELLDQPDEPYDWLVPNLLERMDRLLITAFEGVGKSTLLAQIALTIAAGLHPFTGDVTHRDGHRVLVIDCENSVRQIRRRYRRYVGAVNYLRETRALPPVDWKDQLRFVIAPAGLDLADPRDFGRLEAKIAAAAPDLVVAGPLYRLSKLDIRDEPAAKALVDALDHLRVKYRFTLVIEAHVGHVGEAQGGRKLRPTGSSLLLRWPEFGFGLRGIGDAAAEEHPSIVEMIAWRGSRDERAWPALLKHGDGFLPWTVGNADYDPTGTAA